MHIPAKQVAPYPGSEPAAKSEALTKPHAKGYAPQQPRAPPQSTHHRVLRWGEVRDRVGLSRATVWRLVRRGSFPPPVPLGSQSIGWIEREIDEWLAARAALRQTTSK